MKAMERSANCSYCHQYTLFSCRAQFPSRHGEYWIGECNNPGCYKSVLIHQQEVFPHAMPKVVGTRIPERAMGDFIEARQCFSVQAYRAAGAMARRALQECCLDHGADADLKLGQQIDWMAEQRIVTNAIKDWAHEVRLTGNDCAHPSKKSEAELIWRILLISLWPLQRYPPLVL